MVSDPSVFEVAGDNSFASKCSAEVPNVLQVISGLPKSTVNHEHEREGTWATRQAHVSKVLGTLAVSDAFVENRRRSLQDATQVLIKMNCRKPWYKIQNENGLESSILWTGFL